MGYGLSYPWLTSEGAKGSSRGILLIYLFIKTQESSSSRVLASPPLWESRPSGQNKRWAFKSCNRKLGRPLPQGSVNS